MGVTVTLTFLHQVRDQLTSAYEQKTLAAGGNPRGTLSNDAVSVDAIVSTIGFPLVGGPAGNVTPCNMTSCRNGRLEQYLKDYSSI